MKQEPVSIEYTCPNCQTHVELFHHTSPQYRELIDEEIDEAYIQYLKDNGHYNVLKEVGVLARNFAKAILKKAREK